MTVAAAMQVGRCSLLAGSLARSNPPPAARVALPPREATAHMHVSEQPAPPRAAPGDGSAGAAVERLCFAGRAQGCTHCGVWRGRAGSGLPTGSVRITPAQPRHVTGACLGSGVRRRTVQRRTMQRRNVQRRTVQRRNVQRRTVQRRTVQRANGGKCSCGGRLRRCTTRTRRESRDRTSSRTSSARNMQRATHVVQRATCNTRRATCNMQHTTCSTNRAACDVAPRNVQHATQSAARGRDARGC
jgi:hypothetical protein